MKCLTAEIPHGFQAGPVWIKQVKIRELNGYDEQLIDSFQNFFSPYKTSLLLERIIMEFSNSPQQLDLHTTIRNLSIGDRIALILHLRKIVFGDVLCCTMKCPHCVDALSFKVSIGSLLKPVKSDPQTTYAFELDGYFLKIRPINGSDLENIALNQNTQNSLEKLLRSCILSSDPPLPEILNHQFQEQLNTKLSEIDQQADLTLNINCPLCNKPFETSIDVEDFFFQEIASRYNQLEREVHWIALHYHWSENDILSLPSSKRKRYVELINASLSRGNV